MAPPEVEIISSLSQLSREGIALLRKAARIRAKIEAHPAYPDPWFGVVAPTKTPQDTLARLAGWFAAALQDSDVKMGLAVLGFRPVGACGTDFAAFMRKRYAEYGQVIREGFSGR